MGFSRRLAVLLIILLLYDSSRRHTRAENAFPGFCDKLVSVDQWLTVFFNQVENDWWRQHHHVISHQLCWWAYLLILSKSLSINQKFIHKPVTSPYRLHIVHVYIATHIALTFEVIHNKCSKCVSSKIDTECTAAHSSYCSYCLVCSVTHFPFFAYSVVIYILYIHGSAFLIRKRRFPVTLAFILSPGMAALFCCGTKTCL